jgi:ketosteroid isomerase-like protein
MRHVMTNLFRRRLLALGAIALAGMLLCVPTTSRADWFDSKVEDGVARFVEAFNSGDAAVLGQSYAEDAVVMAPNAAPIEGRDAIIGSWGGFFGAMDAFDLTLSTDYAERNGTLGWSRGDYTLSFTPQGGAKISEAGKYVLI